MDFFWLIMIFILGLTFGSFVNMAIFRVAVIYGLEKINKRVKDKKRSFCDYCGKQLKWYENIPVISWVAQKGKSKCCNKKISSLYPIVELLMGIVFVIIIFKNNFYLASLNQLQGIDFIKVILFLVIAVLLVFSMFFDIKYMILPDFATISLVVLAFLQLFLKKADLLPFLLSGLGVALFFLILYLFTKGKGMGFGDVKFAFFIGLFLGWPGTLVAVYLAFILGALVGVLGMIFGKLKRKSKIAFGPFLIIGFMLTWWWGEKIVNLVL